MVDDVHRRTAVARVAVGRRARFRERNWERSLQGTSILSEFRPCFLPPDSVPCSRAVDDHTRAVLPLSFCFLFIFPHAHPFAPFLLPSSSPPVTNDPHYVPDDLQRFSSPPAPVDSFDSGAGMSASHSSSHFTNPFRFSSQHDAHSSSRNGSYGFGRSSDTWTSHGNGFGGVASASGSSSSRTRTSSAFASLMDGSKGKEKEREMEESIASTAQRTSIFPCSVLLDRHLLSDFGIQSHLIISNPHCALAASLLGYSSQRRELQGARHDEPSGRLASLLG